jgi:hypothetical protein
MYQADLDVDGPMGRTPIYLTEEERDALAATVMSGPAVAGQQDPRAAIDDWTMNHLSGCGYRGGDRSTVVHAPKGQKRV